MSKKIWVLAFAAALPTAAVLVPSCKSKDGGHAAHSQAAEAKKVYHCPMHPTYTADKPGDCPICGMKLVLAEPGQQGQAAQRRPGHGDAPPHGKQPDDRAAISLSAEKQQMIGVRVAPAAKRDLEVLIRASGRVAYDPDLYSAIVEYQEALKAKKNMKDSPWPDVHERAAALIRASAIRLRQMGLSQSQIDQLQGTSENPTNLLLSEKGGSVWIYAQIYEYESGLVKPGQSMEVASSAIDRPLRGRIVAVDAILDPETRTLRVRGEVPNPEGLLKPEMYVDATIHVALGRRLAVPEEAVLDSGTRRIVFVEVAPGNYEPREVKVGRKAEDHYEILSGLKAGEKVVVSANFLIDSESRLKSALSQPGAGHAH